MRRVIALSPAGFVVALAGEARALGSRLPRPDTLATLDDGTLLAISGVGRRAAGAAGDRLIRAGAGGLISFGLAGGLDPTLCAGSLMLPQEIRGPSGPTSPVDANWRRSVVIALPRGQAAVGGVLLTSCTPVLTIQAKRSLLDEFGAAAVDMEAVAVAESAQAACVPFLAIKVIVDTALDVLPRAVMAVGPAGRIRAGQMAAMLLRQPGEILDLIRLAGRYHAAQRTLRAIALVDAIRRPIAEVMHR